MNIPAGVSISSKKAKSLGDKKPSSTRGVVMDGVIYESFATNSKAPQQHLPAQVMHQRPTRSLALMREAVSMPKRRPSIKMDIGRAKKAHSAKTHFGFKVDESKKDRASDIPRSGRISRFGGMMQISKPDLNPTVSKFSARVRSVAQAPTLHSGNLSSQPGATMALARPVAAMPANISHQKLEAMLDRALQQADAHKQMLTGSLSKRHWRRLGKSRAALLATGLVLALAIGIFFAYLHIPSFSVRVASLASGVDAHAPSYIPPGYSLSKTSFKNGDVSLTFSNGSQSFVISQQKSGMNEEALRSSVVAPASKLYQASQYSGVTVFTYGNSASWVNEGVKKTLQNSQGLSSDQKLKIIEGSL